MGDKPRGANVSQWETNRGECLPWETNQRRRELATWSGRLWRSEVCNSGSPSDRRSSSSVVPSSSWDRLSRSAVATRMSVFTVIRSPAPPRFLFSTRARIERLVIWSGHIRNSLRSRRRYLGGPGDPVGACGFGAGAPAAAAGLALLSPHDLGGPWTRRAPRGGGTPRWSFRLPPTDRSAAQVIAARPECLPWETNHGECLPMGDKPSGEREPAPARPRRRWWNLAAV